jgi:hypothetical protein
MGRKPTLFSAEPQPRFDVGGHLPPHQAQSSAEQRRSDRREELRVVHLVDPYEKMPTSGGTGLAVGAAKHRLPARNEFQFHGMSLGSERGRPRLSDLIPHPLDILRFTIATLAKKYTDTFLNKEKHSCLNSTPTKRVGFSGHNIRSPDGSVPIPDEPQLRPCHAS